MTDSERIAQLESRIAQLERDQNQWAITLGISNPSGNYRNPQDLFYVNAGTAVSPLLNIGAFSIGANGSLTQDGFTWTNNSPGAGQIAWTNGVITYKGIQYLIPAGNTNLQWVYWTLASPNAFQTASPFPGSLTADDFAITFNHLGVAELAVNLSNQSNSNRIVLTGSSVWQLNSTSKVVSQIGILGATDLGSLQISDSAGANPITLSAAASFATATAGAGALPAAPAAFMGISVTTGGVSTTYRIPLYLP